MAQSLDARTEARKVLSVISVNSAAELESLPIGSTPQIAATAGYFRPSDGGSGLYVWLPNVNAADYEAGIPSAHSSGIWGLVHQGVLHARQFGARGDGRHDDTIALQHLINVALKTAATIVVDPGVYRITKPLIVNIDGKKDRPVVGFTLRGSGQARIDGEIPEYSQGTRIELDGKGHRAVLLFAKSFLRNPVVEIDSSYREGD